MNDLRVEARRPKARHKWQKVRAVAAAYRQVMAKLAHIAWNFVVDRRQKNGGELKAPSNGPNQRINDGNLRKCSLPRSSSRLHMRPTRRRRAGSSLIQKHPMMTTME